MKKQTSPMRDQGKRSVVPRPSLVHRASMKQLLVGLGRDRHWLLDLALRARLDAEELIAVGDEQHVVGDNRRRIDRAAAVVHFRCAAF